MTSDLLSILSTKSDIPTVTVAGSMRKAPLQLRSGLKTDCTAPPGASLHVFSRLHFG